MEPGTLRGLMLLWLQRQHGSAGDLAADVPPPAAWLLHSPARRPPQWCHLHGETPKAGVERSPWVPSSTGTPCRMPAFPCSPGAALPQRRGRGELHFHRTKSYFLPAAGCFSKSLLQKQWCFSVLLESPFTSTRGACSEMFALSHCEGDR